MLGVVERSNRPERVANIPVIDLFESEAQSTEPAAARTLIQEEFISKHVVEVDELIMQPAGPFVAVQSVCPSMSIWANTVFPSAMQ